MRYTPPSSHDTRWFLGASTQVGAPFTAILQTTTSKPVAMEVLPVPSDVVDCSGCVVRSAEAPNARCHEMPDCHGVTFVPNTPEVVRMAVLRRMGLQP